MMNYVLTRETKGKDVYVGWFDAKEKNQKGESLTVELTLNRRGDRKKNACPDLWLHVHTYVTDSEGGCSGKYNPTLEPYEHGMKLKDDMFLEATKENAIKLLTMVYDVFISATGKSATEEKMKRVEKFAKEKELEIYTTIPEGWKETPSTYYPRGCKRITNGKPWNRIDGKIKKNQDYKEAILV